MIVDAQTQSFYFLIGDYKKDDAPGALSTGEYVPCYSSGEQYI